MKKKIASLLLILVLCVSVFGGCVLFDRDMNADYAQVVVRIQNIEIGTENGKPVYFSRDITKRDLALTYQNYGSQMQEQGISKEDAVNGVLDQLINREIMVARYERMIISGEIEIGEVQEVQGFNRVWKTVYEYCDAQINSIERSLYTYLGLSAPEYGAPAGENKYPDNNMITKELADQKKDAEKNVVPAKFSLDKSRIPAATDTNRLDAVKRFMVSTIQGIEARSLSKEEKKLLQADKDFVNDNSKKTELYQKIMGNGELDESKNPEGFFSIRKLIAESQLAQIKYERLQEYYNEKLNASVSDNEIQAYYNDTLISQRVSFNESNLSSYITALKNESGDTPFVFYNPTSEVFYVKHILVPFSESQTAAITAYGKGKTAAQKTAYRDSMARYNITSYAHKDGNDDTSVEYTMEQIYNEVIMAMGNYKNRPDIGERIFNDLIFKYNTDPGIFNNEKGYLMPPPDKGIASGYVPEFEIAAYELFKNYNPGDMLPDMVITDYGVHLMMYSSHTEKGIVKLDDPTSPLRLKTYRDAVSEYILSRKQQEHFDAIQKDIVNQYNRGDTYIKKYVNRYKDLYKETQAEKDAVAQKQAEQQAQQAQDFSQMY